MNHVSAILQRFLSLHPKKIDLSLGRLLALLNDLGNPHQKLPPVVHVAGTNGKGSTIAYMRAMLEASGKTVHVYTSPHLVRFNERIRLGEPGGGKLVEDTLLAETMAEVERINADRPITFFEITTAIAFKLFSENPADYLLLEVGLGGRLDATNVVDRPMATVLTPIAMDHEQFLGDKVEQIALEKAGILKSGAPATSAAQSDAVRRVLDRQAARVGTAIVYADEDFSVIEENGRLVYQDEGSLIDLPLPRLLGRHQTQNAGLAVATLRAAGIDLPQADMETGLKSAQWPARMQHLASGHLVDRLLDGAELWVDGGHNPNAGEAISHLLADLEERSERPLFLICGMLNTKDPAGFLAHFTGLVRHVFAVPVRSSDAGRDPRELVDIARSVGLTAETAPDATAAIDRLSSKWLPFEHPPRILVCGSLYLAGEVLAANGTPPR